MNKEFETAYEQLNPAQRQAVDTIDGPVLVIAGPGTGKTQLLSLRVANILKETDTDPSSILCLTFTNFAATNMRERLTKLVGPSAHNVMVKTFHSFAAEIMNLYPDYFWNGARLSLAPDAVQIEIIEGILAELSLDNPLALKFAGSFTAVNDVQKALQLSKEAGLTPEKLSAMIEVNKAYIDVIEPRLIEALSPTLSIKRLEALQDQIDALPDQPINASVTPLTSLSTIIKEGLVNAIADDERTGKTTNTGKWKKRWMQSVQGDKGMFDEHKRNAWWEAIAPVYKKYRDTLHGRGYYDYSDMLVEVITQLEQNPELLASVQEKFLYVMIDEFQDSNAAQLRLAHLVSDSESTDGSPNLLAVGDDDQTIFAFNGAELNNMLSFRRTYRDTNLIVLQQNYRSTQAILDESGKIIANAEDRLINREEDLSKDLVAASKPPIGEIRHISYPTHEHQLSALADTAKEAWSRDKTKTVAILSRSHKSLREISALLNRLDVPIAYEQQNNILEQALVQQVSLLAEIVVAIQEGNVKTVNWGLAKLLQSPAWQIDPKTLWQLAIANRRTDSNWLDSLLESENKELVKIGNWLIWLARLSSSEPLSVLLDHLIGLRDDEAFVSPLRQYFLQAEQIDNTYLDGLSALQTLLSACREFTASRSTPTTLADFVRFIHLHQQLDRPITDESWFVSGEQALQLMTVHKAKGLEFDTVIILDAIEENWKPRHIGRKPPANLPLQPYGEQYDDYVRLLYVAATRAKSSLIIGSYYTDGQGKDLLSTPLISHLEPEIIDSTNAEVSQSVLEKSLSWPRLDTKDEKALLGVRMQDYKLSVTALLQFLDVKNGGPKQFLERQILRLPTMTTTDMAYGTAVHKALQNAQLMVNSEKFDLKKVLESYDTALGLQQLPAVEHERYITHGRQILESLFARDDFKIVKGAQAEFSLSDVQMGTVRLSGNLDSVDIEDNELIITDYKTGKPLSTFDTHDQTKAVKAWRHTTQLLFYTLLTANNARFKSIKATKPQMLYVEAERGESLKLALQPTQESLDRLQKLITAVWKHIIDLDFPDTSHYSDDIQGIKQFEDDLISGKI